MAKKSKRPTPRKFAERGKYVETHENSTLIHDSAYAWLAAKQLRSFNKVQRKLKKEARRKARNLKDLQRKQQVKYLADLEIHNLQWDNDDEDQEDSEDLAEQLEKDMRQDLRGAW